MRVAVRPCVCGGRDLQMHRVRCAEDAMATWISCSACGGESEHIEDAYSDPAGAADLWNRRRFEAAQDVVATSGHGGFGEPAVEHGETRRNGGGDRGGGGAGEEANGGSG